MSLELKPGVVVTLHLKDRGSDTIRRKGTILHVSATTILLELTLNYNIDYDDHGNILNGNYNYNFDEIVRIDPN